MTNYWKLAPDRKTPIPSDIDDPEWRAMWDSHKTRVLDQTQIGDALVSTVFLGIDHSWMDEQDPILWETMVFNPHDESRDDMTRRYSTWEAAQVGHAETILEVLERYGGESKRSDS